MRSENQDSVLPLVQVICTQLYERKRMQPGSDGVITREGLDAIKGVEGGLKAFAEDALVRSMRLDTEDREAFKRLFTQLYIPQADGTLTTWLMPRESLERQWNRPSPFADLLDAARSVRLLREDELRIQGGEPRRYVRLGHDALAKVAAAWQAEREAKQNQPPNLLDRLGATLINFTRPQPKHLLWLGSGFLVLMLIVNYVGLLRPFRGLVDKIVSELGGPILYMGVFFLCLSSLGAWLRKIAKRSSAAATTRRDTSTT